VDRLTDLIFRETTTIGVRSYTARRRTLQRESIPVETPLGRIRMKVSRLNGHVLNVAPEYEDCQRVAAEHGVPLKQVLAEAAFQFQKLFAIDRKAENNAKRDPEEPRGSR